MSHNLPVLHCNETLYSWCGMAHAMQGNTRSTDTSLDLFGSKFAALRHDFPSHLSALCTHARNCLGTPEQLAHSHTLLGYYLPLLEAPDALQILEDVSVGARPSLKMELGITASRLGGHHPLKACPKCVELDLHASGYAYWHLDHQLPSAFICTQHDRPLQIAWDPKTPVHRREWLLPASGFHKEWRPIEIPAREALLVHRLADNSMELARLRPAQLDPERLGRTYRDALRQAGLATDRGNLKLQIVVPRLRTYYRGIEHLPGMRVVTSICESTPGFIGSLSRRSIRRGHPFKHLLLITFLFDSWLDFINAYSTGNTISTAEPTPPTTTDSDLRRARFSDLMVKKCLTVSEASTAVGVSTTTGTQWARAMALPFGERPKQILGPVRRRIEKDLAQGFPVAGICKRLQVSASTVNRVLGCTPKAAAARNLQLFIRRRSSARKTFSTLCSKHHDEPLSRIRKIPGNSYHWLYRNDREWLRDVIRDREGGRVESTSVPARSN